MGHDNESRFSMDPDDKGLTGPGSITVYGLDPLVEHFNREFLQRHDMGYRLSGAHCGCQGGGKEQAVEVRASVHALDPL